MFPTKSLFQLVLFACALSFTSGAILTSPSQLTTTNYDYVIVGAGTAGSLIANRLTENPNVQVLLLEAGVSNEGVLGSQVPLLAPSLTPSTLYDWNYTTTTQTGFNGRTIPYPRGRMLGGSSSVNFMIYGHGNKDDYDRLAAVTGDSGWNHEHMALYVPKVENFVPPVDGHDTTGQYNPAVHGKNGMVDISLSGFPSPLDQRVINTTKEMSAEFPFNLDQNSGSTLGIGWAQFLDGKGQRSSSATAYLSPDYQKRSNLHILINAQVTRLVQTGTYKGKPSIHRVEFGTGPGSPLTLVTARKEVILSAGSVGTPQILQLSGIGDKTALSALGINTIVNNPSVGANMSDHVLLPNIYSVAGSASFDDIFRDQSLLGADINQWLASKTGPLTAGVATHLGWLRLPNNASIFSSVPDPSNGPMSSHFEFIFGNLFVLPGVPFPATGHYMTLATNLISPTSRGSVKLVSKDPFTAPAINPNFLSTAFDIFTIREAVKSAKRFMTGSAWKDYVIAPYGDFANANSDAEIENYARNTASTVWHMTGTASMSPANAPWGVVDPNLKLKGVEGVRIVDGSVLPFSPNAHTTGPIYLIAERAANLIKLTDLLNTIFSKSDNSTDPPTAYTDSYGITEDASDA